MPKKISSPPIIPLTVRCSPPYKWAKRAPNTGSAENIIAVLVGVVNLWKYVWAQKAKLDAKREQIIRVNIILGCMVSN